MSMKSPAWMMLMLLLVASHARAGSFVTTALCATTGDCVPGIPVSEDPKTSEVRVPPRAVVHPPGYDGSVLRGAT